MLYIKHISTSLKARVYYFDNDDEAQKFAKFWKGHKPVEKFAVVRL